MAIFHFRSTLSSKQIYWIICGYASFLAFGLWFAHHNAGTRPLDVFTLIGMNLVFIYDFLRNLYKVSIEKISLSNRNKLLLILLVFSAIVSTSGIIWRDNNFALFTILLASQTILAICSCISFLKRY